MNPLLKKEIRLLLPSWAVAMPLAMVQGITQPYDFNIAFLLFFGLSLMALTTIGRETSLNTFSSLLAQPAERLQIWKIKLSVLAGAFLTVLAVWLAALAIACIRSSSINDTEAYYLFVSICLIATTTFTGGLWTTLLLRQLAGAFWLTLLVPAVLAGIAAAFLAGSETDYAVIAALAVIFAVYSIGGFFFARWLFFRAQDIGWSGGTLVLPELKWFGSRAENAASIRSWQPMAALFKKEFQLQQVSLFGAAGLLILHLGVLVWRGHHKFLPDSAGEILTSIFWMLWLVLPVVLGSTTIAEERKLGVMESQLCLPVSRRRQFAIKAFLTLILGTFLGGVLPMFLEAWGGALGAPNPLFVAANFSRTSGVIGFEASIVGLAAALALVSLFASTLTKSFLQAVGVAIGTFIGFTLLTSTFTGNQVIFIGSLPSYSVLPLLIAIPTTVVILLWLAYRNFGNFRDGWPLWRRNLLGLVGAYVFIIATSTGLYNRVWEVFEPAEPAHDPARFSLSNPPEFGRSDSSGTIQVRLPTGQVWVSSPLRPPTYWENEGPWKFWRRLFISPLPKIIGTPQFIPGSNWVSVLASYPQYGNFIDEDLEAIGVQADGSLWLMTKPRTTPQTSGLTRLSSETNWLQVTMSPVGILLLKNDGTLWRWRDFFGQKWSHLSALSLENVGTDSNWKELSPNWPGYAKKQGGTVWMVEGGKGKISFALEPQLEPVDFRTLSFEGDSVAYVRPDGTLWLDLIGNQGLRMNQDNYLQVGGDTDWQAVAISYRHMVALKSDGSLWQWDLGRDPFHDSPTQLGIHHDWVALADRYNATIALAADGSLWLWPDPEYYDGYWSKLPKQPQFLGRISDASR